MGWIKEKKINIIYLIASFLIVVTSFVVNVNFRETFSRKLSESIFWLTIPILVFSIITFMIKKSVFLSWAKVTNYLFVVFVVIILLTPTSTHGLDFIPIVKETVTILLASLYSIISLFIILYKSLKKEKK